MKRSRSRISVAELRAKEAMREDVERFCAGQCWLLQKMPGHVCDGPLDLHHLIRKSFLKAYASTLPPEEKWAIVHHPNLGVLVCRGGNGGHDQITTAFHRLPWEYLPQRAVETASELGIEWRLRQESPPLAEVMGLA